MWPVLLWVAYTAVPALRRLEGVARMSVLTRLTEDEAYLAALLFDDPSGIDMCEAFWVDEEKDDRCFRVRDYQWPWYRCTDTFQADQCSRDVGKSLGITMRAFSHPFCRPGAEYAITAPELNHLRPVTDKIERILLDYRISRELLQPTKGHGINHQPQFQAQFRNRAMIISRLPNRDGKGVKGLHSHVIEIDEAQDFPEAGWVEITEALKRGAKGSMWKIHGVARGVRDKFYQITQDDSGWTVHRYQAMYRDTWSKSERDEKIKTYGGSRGNPDYRRNIYGQHGDATNPLFVLARLMACVDLDRVSDYNENVYTTLRITHERIESGMLPAAGYVRIPGSHKTGWDGCPQGYAAYYAGMDVGMTNHPSELLVYGQRARKEQLDLLLRVHMERVDTQSQLDIVRAVFDFYGERLRVLGFDKTGVGYPLWDILRLDPNMGSRIRGYNFSGKYAVGFEDREMTSKETMADLALERNFVEFSSDALREWVDGKKMLLPYDQEVLGEWQGQTYTVVKSNNNPYGKRDYARGSFHTLDAGKCMIAGKVLESIEPMLAKKNVQTPVLEAFVGAMM
jgi:hypothetical protein